MDKRKMKKLLILNLPYFLVGLFATNLGEAWRLAEGADSSAKILSFFHALPIALNLSLIHISEPTRRTPISYAVFCLKKKKKVND